MKVSKSELIKNVNYLAELLPFAFSNLKDYVNVAKEADLFVKDFDKLEQQFKKTLVKVLEKKSKL